MTMTMRLHLLCGLACTALAAADLPNVAQTPGALLNGPIAPELGRTAIIAWHGGRIVAVPEIPGSQAGADIQVRIVDIRDPANPGIVVKPYRASGFNAHGYFHYGPYLYIGPHETVPGNGQWRDSFFTTGSGVLNESNIETNGGMPVSTYNRSGAQSPWGAEMWWSYGEVTGNAFLTIRRSLAEWTHDWANNGAPTGPAVKARWDHLGRTGVVGMPFIIGNILLYASDQTGTGVASYDISDPSNPVLLDVLKESNPGGYWPEIWGHYLFFPRRNNEGGQGSSAGFMVVDFQDPSHLRVVANRNLDGSNQYVCFQDEFAFMNKYKIDLRSFETVLTLPTNDTTLDASQFALPVGNLLVTGGYGSSGPGLAIWAHQAAPDTRGPWVAYHVPRPDQTGYSTQCPITLSIPETLRTETIINGTTLVVRPVGGAAVDCWHSFGQNKLLTVTPRQPLAANTTYEVLLTNGIQDAVGNGLEPYSFRFSTGSGLSGGNRPPVVTALAANPARIAPNASIAFTAIASDPDGGTLQYRFDFGDGSAKTAWQSGTGTSHAYIRIGHWRATVQVRDPAGAIGSFSRNVTVAPAPATPAGLHSSAIILGGRRIHVVNPDSDTLATLDADSRAVLWERATAADPRGVASGSDGSLWVACHDGDRIEVRSGTDGTVLAELPTGHGSAPIAVCASPDGATMYATCTGDGTLRRFSVSGRNQSGSLVLGPTPRAIAITGNGGRALITRFVSGEHDGSVYDVNLAGSMTLARTIRLRRDYSRDGSASGRGVPNYLAAIAIAPDGTKAWIVGKKDNTERGAFTDPGKDLSQDNTVRVQLMMIDLASNAEDVAARVDLDNSDSPTAIAFSPNGDYAFLALQGNAQVAVLDVLDLTRADTPGTMITRFGTGLAPQGLVIDAATGRLWSQDFLGRTVTVRELADLLNGGSFNLPAAAIPTVASELLSATVLAGKRIFYHAGDARMSAEGYISCATCHVDGGHDGRTWDFTGRGEGFRNTTDLRGRRGLGHGNVHWSGNFDEIQDFEHDIRGAFGGRGFLSDADFAATNTPLGAPKAGRSADLDALAAYVSSLGQATVPKSPRRSADGSRTAEAVSGAAIFTREHCASCHIPAQGYVDRLRHDVGTLRASSGKRLNALLNGIDTPTLLGIHATAPYFHDGSAASLEDVFTLAGGDLRQAESGTVANGAAVDAITWIVDKQWHGREFVEFDNNNEQVAFNGIAGGAGGSGFIELRYTAHYSNATLAVIVNGTTTTVTAPVSPNEPGWYPNEWRRLQVPVTWASGSVNAVSLRRTNGGSIKIDDVLFSTPVHHVLAAPHRRVAALPSAEQTALLAFLRQLDGQDVPADPTPTLLRRIRVRTSAPATVFSLLPEHADPVLDNGDAVFQGLDAQQTYVLIPAAAPIN